MRIEDLYAKEATEAREQTPAGQGLTRRLKQSTSVYMNECEENV